MLERIEYRTKHGSTIFCTQFEPEGWYSRMNPEPESGSPICDSIMDRIIHNFLTGSLHPPPFPQAYACKPLWRWKSSGGEFETTVV